MLTLRKRSKDSKPIAKIHKGEYKNKILYIDPNYLEGRGDFELPQGDTGKLIQHPDPLNCRVLFVAGPSGSGKTTYVANYAIDYNKLFPKNDIWVFSRLPKDDLLDKVIPKKRKVKPPLEDLLEEPFDANNEMKNCLVIFDDIDTVQDDKTKEAIYKIMRDVLEIGRHNNINVIITSHLIVGNDRKNSRTILNEAQCLTVFPKSGTAQQIRYVLKQYLGISNDEIENILNLPSRWVTIAKSYPQYVFYSSGAYTFN